MKFDKQDTNIAKTIAIIMMYIHHSFLRQNLISVIRFLLRLSVRPVRLPSHSYLKYVCLCLCFSVLMELRYHL